MSTIALSHAPAQSRTSQPPAEPKSKPSTVPLEISLKTANCGECENAKDNEQVRSFMGTQGDIFEVVKLGAAENGG